MVFTLILPTTIHVNNCYAVQRDNPVDRLQDTIVCLEKWLSNTNFRIVLVENSNTDLSFLKPLQEGFPGRLELLSFDGNDYPREYGKGYGEMLSINYAVDNSKFVSQDDYVLKCTGRYFLSELSKVFDENFDNNFQAVVYSSEDYPDGSASVFFYLKKNIYQEKMATFFVNDSKGNYFEHALQNTIKSLLADSVLKIDKMGIEGISGTANKPVIWMK